MIVRLILAAFFIGLFLGGICVGVGWYWARWTDDASIENRILIERLQQKDAEARREFWDAAPELAR
jgi:hypothetical protein